jgi:hypothetical protein
MQSVPQSHGCTSNASQLLPRHARIRPYSSGGKRTKLLVDHDKAALTEPLLHRSKDACRTSGQLPLAFISSATPFPNVPTACTHL